METKVAAASSLRKRPEGLERMEFFSGLKLRSDMAEAFTASNRGRCYALASMGWNQLC